MSSPVKNKKKNKMLNQDDSEIPHKKKKSKKIFNENNFGEETENDEVVQESYNHEKILFEPSTPSKKDKGAKKKNHFDEVVENYEVVQEVNKHEPHKKKKKLKKTFKENNFEEETENDEVVQESYNYEDIPLEQSSPSKKDKGMKKKTHFDEVVENNEVEEVNEHEEMSLEQTTPSKKEKGGLEEDNWTKDDYKELIRRLQQQIPKNDNKGFSTTIEKLDWSQVQFGSHSVEECYEKWKVLRTKVRHYRLLGEVLQDAMTWAESPGESSLNKKKKDRHPDQPTKPLTSFMIFYMDKKDKIIKRHPSLKMPDLSRMIGDKFKSLSEEKKAYYAEKAASLQVEYKQNLKEFYEKHPELIPAPKKTTKAVQKPLAPFKLFLLDKLSKHELDEDFNKLECTDKYRVTWKSLSLKKKAKWIRLALEEEDKYWKHREDLNGKSKPSNHKSVVTKDELAILDRLAGKPEKPPNSAYGLFSKLMLQDKEHHLAEGEPKTRMKEVGSKWKMLPEESKREYEEEWKHMMEKYKLEFANYLESLPEDKKAEELAKVQPKKKITQPKKVQKNTTKEKTDLFKNVPVKPPALAWDLFKQEYVSKNRHLTSEEACNAAAKVWKRLPSKETEKYMKKLESLKAKYIIDYEKFLKSLSEEELTEYSRQKENHKKEESAQESSDEEEAESSSSEGESSEQSDSGVSEDEY